MSPIPFELRPVDVALMVILQQDVPSFKRPAVVVAFARTTVDDIGPLLALP